MDLDSWEYRGCFDQLQINHLEREGKSQSELSEIFEFCRSKGWDDSEIPILMTKASGSPEAQEIIKKATALNSESA